LGFVVLTGLRLDNIALIERLELAFEQGFSVLTGETGAGKSLLLDALDALLGGMQGTTAGRLVRTGCDRAVIEATFTPDPAARRWLQEHQLDDDGGDLVLSREWRRQDERLSSRSRLNGTVVNRQQLLELRPLLIDLTVQGQTQQLAYAGQQRRWIDRLGGEPLAQCLRTVSASWQVWQNCHAEVLKLETDRRRFKEQQEEQDALLMELEAASLDDPAEIQQLEQEQDRLVHGVRLLEGLAVLIGRLQDGAEQAPSALDHLTACCHELQQLQSLDSSLSVSAERCLDMEAGLLDLIRSIEAYGASLESDPERLGELQERLALLKRLERRYGVELKVLIERRDTLRDQNAAGGADAALEVLRDQEQEARKHRDSCNQSLTVLRQASAACLEERLMTHLRPMGLENVRFRVDFSAVEPMDLGADAICFLFSANPGQPLSPLAEVASGGEMSRFLLALKTCLADVDGSSTLLFDEIDSGVSGRVSGEMANLLRTMAKNRQVFCVTHQPLVAAAADHHFRVSKEVVDGETRSRVSHLRDTQARRQELAELAGGDFDDAQAYAASLLEQRAA
jgi:DNA repair protein RecN (Recombination protein N)